MRIGFPGELTVDLPYPGAAGFPVLDFGDDNGFHLPSTPALQFGANDFTIEFWMKADASQTHYAMVAGSSTNNTETGVGVGINLGGTTARGPSSPRGNCRALKCS